MTVLSLALTVLQVVLQVILVSLVLAMNRLNKQQIAQLNRDAEAFANIMAKTQPSETCSNCHLDCSKCEHRLGNTIEEEP